MNYDEFAFFNQQLAGMLREGIPLEGALKQLTHDMARGNLRAQFQALGSDLARGIPLNEAVAKRNLPPLYVRMLAIGARSNDLPAVLMMVADHYQRANALWTRLKGLLMYPVIVLALSLLITVLLSVVFHHVYVMFQQQFNHLPEMFLLTLWIPPIAVAVIAIIFVAMISVRRFRANLRWRLPAFREASLAQLASALALMIEHGTPVTEALSLAESLEGSTVAGRALALWRAQVEAGVGKPEHWRVAAFPPLFLWLVRSAGENLAEGFRKAAKLYQDRAVYRTELALYGALPISILFVGQLVLWQLVPLIRAFSGMMSFLTNPFF